MKAIAYAVLGAVVMCLSAWQPSRAAEATPIAAPDYPLHRVTDKIYVIYGPFDLPDNKNRGFRNTAVIVLASRGVVVFDPGGSAYAGEMVVKDPDPQQGSGRCDFQFACPRRSLARQ